MNKALQSPRQLSSTLSSQPNDLLETFNIASAIFVDDEFSKANSAFYDLFPPEAVEEVKNSQKIHQTIHELSIIPTTLSFDFTDNRDNTYHCLASPYRGADGRSVIVFFEDISAEAASERNNAFLYRLSLLLSTTKLPLKEKLQLAVDQILFEIPVFDCSILLFDKLDGRLRPIAWGTSSIESSINGQGSFGIGEGVAGHVALTKKPVVVPNVLTDKRFVRQTTDAEAVSLLCVPLLASNELLGTMCVSRKVNLDFTDKEVQLFTTIASRLVAVIEVDTNQQIKTKQAELSRLLSSSRGTKEDYDQITTVIVDLLSIDQCFIFHRNSRDHKLFLKRVDIEQQFDHQEIQLLEELIDRAQTKKHPLQQPWIVVDDQKLEDFHLNRPKSSIKGSVLFPLMVRKLIVGFIFIRTTQWQRHYSLNELHLGASLATQVALAFENAAAYEEILEQQQKLDQIHNTLRDGLILYTPDMRIATYNAAARRLFGFRKDVAGLPWELVLKEEIDAYCAHPINRQFDPREFLRLAVEEGKISTGLATLDGPQPKTIEVVVAPVYDRHNEISGVLSHFRDITQIHDLQSKMAARVQQLTNLFKISSVTGFNSHQIIQRILKLVVPLLSVKSAQLILCNPDKKSLSVAQTVGSHPQLHSLQPTLLKKAQLVMKKQEPQAFRFQPKGAREPIHALILPIHGQHEACAGVVLVIDKENHHYFSKEDTNLLAIVASQIASKLDTVWLLNQIEAERNKLAAIIDQSVDGILVVDHQERITIWNPALERLTGISKAEALDQTLESVRGLVEIVEEHGETNEAVRELLIRHRKTDRLIWLGVANAPITRGKEIIGSIALVRNISRQKELEKSKNDFVSTASHELRSPITAIVGYLSMLKRGDAGQIVDKQQAFFVDKAYQNAKRMVALIEDLLMTTRMETGQVRYQNESVNIGEIVDSLLSDLAFRAEEKSIKVSFDRTHQTRVIANRDGLHQVLNNLLTNAIKYTPAHGSIKIDFQRNDREQPPQLITRIQDTGVGIDSADQKKIFDKFTRVDNPLSVSAGGTGLGLYITRSIVEQIGGRIWVESTKNKGSTFYLSLPLAKK